MAVVKMMQMTIVYVVDVTIMLNPLMSASRTMPVVMRSVCNAAHCFLPGIAQYFISHTCVESPRQLKSDPSTRSMPERLL